jgi:hypothetical protein
MIAYKFNRIVNVKSHAVKILVAMLALSNGARAGPTGSGLTFCPHPVGPTQHLQT